MMKKINLYFFIQLIKSCTLIFFIFLSIAWLLQISRLLTFLNNFQVKFIDTVYLSIYLIPNLINIILPFIVIFGFVIAFIKLDKDKEIIATFSLGLSINEIRKPILYFVYLIALSYIFLNFFISPYVYNKYKIKEHELRQSINLDNVNITNFLEINKNLILDFKRENNLFKDVFINFKENNENIIYAEQAKIEKKNGELIFNLMNGFKIEFIEKEIQKLEFSNYKISIPIKTSANYDNVDENALTIIKIISDKNYFLLMQKIIEILILISIILFFYYNNICNNNFKLKSIFFFVGISITVLIFNSLLKNVNINYSILILLNLTNLSLFFLFIIFNKNKRYE